MRNLTIAILASYLLGILTYSAAESIGMVFLLAGSFLLAAAVKALLSKKFITPLGIMSACFAFGLLGTFFFSDLPQKSFYHLLDEPITLTARLTDVPEFDGEKTTYQARMLTARTADGTVYPLKENVLIYSYGDQPPADKQFYDVVEFKTTLSLPREEMNEGNFDYAMYLKGKNIFVVAETKEAVITNLGRQSGGHSILTPVYTFKAAALQKIDQYLTGAEKGLVKALLLGVKSDLPDETEEDFRRAGLSHVLAISGLHLNILLLYFSVLIALIPRRPRRIAGPLLNIFAALFILFLTGGSASVSRAAIMLILANLASLFFRERDQLQSLLLAAIILLVINPASAYSISFLLSFLATLGIVLFAGKFSRFVKRFIPSSYVADSVAITLCAQIFTLPVIAYVFNEVSTITILSNLVVIPFLPLLTIAAILFLAAAFLLPFVANFAAGFVFITARAVLFIVHLLAKIPFSAVTVGGKHFVIYLLAAAFIGFCIYACFKTKQRKDRIVSCCAIAIAVCCVLAFRGVGSTTLEVTFLNVGQGDAALIRTPQGQTILVDGGGTSSPSSDTGKNIIQPYLLRRGITHLDCAVVSHFHDDHTEGIISMLSSFPIGSLIVPACETEDSNVKEDVLSAAIKQHIPIYYFSAGSQIQLDNGITLDTLSPQKDQFYDANNSSLVLRLSYGESDFLFTGDIEKQTEAQLAATLPQTDVLKTPHHGSDTSSSAPLLDAAQPDIAVISVGEDNKYGHPSGKTLQAFQQRGITWYRTDQSGTITLKAQANGEITVQTRKGDAF